LLALIPCGFCVLAVSRRHPLYKALLLSGELCFKETVASPLLLQSALTERRHGLLLPYATNLPSSLT